MTLKRKLILLTVGSVVFTSLAAAVLAHVLGGRAVERAWESRFADFTDALVLPIGRALAAGDQVLVDAHVIDLSSREGLYIESMRVTDENGNPVVVSGSTVETLSAFRFHRPLEWNGESVGQIDVVFGRTPVQLALREMDRLLLLIAVVASIIAAVVAAHLADRLVRPLSLLASSVSKLQEGSDTIELPRSASSDEIGGISNAMVEAYDELRRRALRNREMVERLQEVTTQLKGELALNAVLRERLEEENRQLLAEVKSQSSATEIIGSDGDLEPLIEQARHAASSRLTVLLSGESGTGKELFAALIHRLSDRSEHSFVTVNCAALPENLIESELFGHERGAFTGATQAKAGKFLLAHRGSIFLDEIGELPLAMQPKLLRVLEAREVDRIGADRPTPIDVRVIAATNRDLAAEVEAGRFRQDLYFRLKVVQLQLPPLRARPNDLVSLVDAQLRDIAREMRIPPPVVSPAALKILRDYAWPGNVRELRHVLAATLSQSRSAVLDAEHVTRALPTSIARTSRSPSVDAGPVEEFDVALARVELGLLELTLSRGGTQKEMAQQLGLSETRLHRLLKKHGLLRRGR